MFGVSSTTVHFLIGATLPYLVEYFVKFIPNRVASNATSKMSHRIVAVIDSTLHATKKSARHQHLDYSEHYMRHGMLTTLLVNFDGYISAFVTGTKARQHDSMACYFFPLFPKVLGSNYALGDPGYAGVPYVIAGLKNNQVTTQGRE